MKEVLLKVEEKSFIVDLTGDLSVVLKGDSILTGDLTRTGDLTGLNVVRMGLLTGDLIVVLRGDLIGLLARGDKPSDLSGDNPLLGDSNLPNEDFEV